MKHGRYLIGTILGLLLWSSVRGEDPPGEVWNFLESHCVDCHEGDSAEGGIDFYSLPFDLKSEEMTRRWILVHDQVTAGTMPPEKKPRPDQGETKTILSQLSADLTKATEARSDVVLRRLNRYEYQNTVRDLFGINLRIDGLPEDTPTDGFDNVGEGLAVSAEAMQAYLDVADRVLDAVFGPAKDPGKVHHKTNLLEQVDWKGRPQFSKQIGKMFRLTKEGLVIFQSGFCPTNLVNFSRLKVPVGTYRGKIRVRAIQSEKPVTLRIYGGDTIVTRRENHLVGYYDVPPDKWTTITFEDELVEPGGTFRMACYGTRDTRKDADTWPEPGIEIGDIEIEGPLEEWPPPSRKNLLGDIDPATATLEDAKKIISKILPLAFRRPVLSDEMTYFGSLFEKAAAEPDRSFESALRLSLTAILCSPEFLFLEDGNASPIGPFALASRLSYFLWSAPPDKDLIDLASANQLYDPGKLREQTERMLQDPRADQFVKNFTGQWLGLRDINFTEPDQTLFPEFDELLRISMVKETKLFFSEVLREDLSVRHFVDSDFSFLNERLARHYEIPGVSGQEFQKVTFPGNSVRGGLLTHASVLKITANGTNTSPVLRGVWVLDNILGTPTSPPPDNVGSVEPDIRGTTTLREMLEKHRDSKTCASCHQKIDPPGFALEQFDPIGGFRTNYRTLSEDGKRPAFNQHPITYAWVRYRIGLPVDPSGETRSGEAFTGIRDFKSLLARDTEQIARNLAQKLSTYALGRKIGFSDRPAIEKIVKRSAENDYRFRSLIHEIIQSEMFRQP